MQPPLSEFLLLLLDTTLLAMLPSPSVTDQTHQW